MNPRHKAADDAEQARRDAIRDAAIARCKQPQPKKEIKEHTIDHYTLKCIVCGMSKELTELSFNGCLGPCQCRHCQPSLSTKDREYLTCDKSYSDYVEAKMAGELD